MNFYFFLTNSVKTMTIITPSNLSLWDLLPTEIQLYIREISSTTLIQRTYRKNRTWYFRRLAAIKRKCPDFNGRNYRGGDRVLIIRKDHKLQYGTINAISYRDENSYCRAILGTNENVYYYKKDKTKYNKEDIVFMRILRSWNYCVCSQCSPTKCDKCVIKAMK